MHLFTDLLKARQDNDRAVMEAYGFKHAMAEPGIAAELMKRYLELAGRRPAGRYP